MVWTDVLHAPFPNQASSCDDSGEDVMNGDRISFLNINGYEFAFLPRPRQELVCVFVVDSIFRPFDIQGAM